VHTVKVTVGRTTGLTVILPYPEHRFILTYPGTMYELAYEDIDLDYVCSARHFHMSSFFLHRGLRSHTLEVFRLSKLQGLRPRSTPMTTPTTNGTKMSWEFRSMWIFSSPMSARPGS